MTRAILKSVEFTDIYDHNNFPNNDSFEHFRVAGSDYYDFTGLN